MKIPKMTEGMELSTQVATMSNLAVDIPNDVKDLFNISGNMEGVVPRLPQIKIIHAGQLFKMPDESKVGDFEGVILDQHPANAFWEKDMSESGGSAVPDCFSMDSITPDKKCEKKQFENCTDCPKNQFGSDRKGGNGKDCKNMKRLHVLMEGSLLPRRLTIPPTSIRSFETYMTSLVDSGLPYGCVISKFTLSPKEYDGVEYSVVDIVRMRVATKEEISTIAAFIKQYKQSARKQEIRKDEYVNAEDNDLSTHDKPVETQPVQEEQPPISNEPQQVATDKPSFVEPVQEEIFSEPDNDIPF